MAMCVRVCTKQLSWMMAIWRNPTVWTHPHMTKRKDDCAMFAIKYTLFAILGRHIPVDYIYGYIELGIRR